MTLRLSWIGRSLSGTVPSLWRSVAGWLGVAALVSFAGAQSPSFLPTYAYVQEAEPIVLTLTHGTSERWLDAIGLTDEGPLSIAFREPHEAGLRLAFRIAGEEPITVRRLVLGDPTGTFVDADVGVITVVPAVATGTVPLRRRATAYFGDGAVLQGWRLVNETGDPQVVRRLDFAPAGVGRPVAVARIVPAGEVADDFPVWLDRLRQDLATLVPEGRRAAPARVEAALRTVLPAHVVRDPRALGVILGPGETLDLVLTSASFAIDLSEVRLLADPILHGEDLDGSAWTGSLSEPVRAGPWP